MEHSRKYRPNSCAEYSSAKFYLNRQHNHTRRNKLIRDGSCRGIFCGGNGISNYTSQNIGAVKFERVRAGFKAGLKLVWVICVPLAVLYFFFGGILVRIFLDEPSNDAMSTGILFLRILSPFYFVVSAKLVSDGILRGAGKWQVL